MKHAHTISWLKTVGGLRKLHRPRKPSNRVEPLHRLDGGAPPGTRAPASCNRNQGITVCEDMVSDSGPDEVNAVQGMDRLDLHRAAELAGVCRATHQDAGGVVHVRRLDHHRSAGIVFVRRHAGSAHRRLLRHGCSSTTWRDARGRSRSCGSTPAPRRPRCSAASSCCGSRGACPRTSPCRSAPRWPAARLRSRATSR